MAIKEYKAEKMFYTMGEITEMFDVRASLVRFWTERFDILKPKKNKKGNRLFSPEDVKNLETIYHLVKERGMTLAGVEKYLKSNREGAERDTELMRRLQTVRGLLVEIREELKEGPEGGDTVSFIQEPAVELQEEIATAEPAEAPDPEEFAEEELPGEVIGEESEPELEPESEAEADEEDLEENFFDHEISEPFTAQPLFEVTEKVDLLFFSEEEGVPAEDREDHKQEIADTQQSLF